MEEKLKEVDSIFDDINNIPLEIYSIVKAICRGYIRESNGKISMDGIKNLSRTMFIGLEEKIKSNYDSAIHAQTGTYYDSDCNIYHKLVCKESSNYIKLINILTHEVGHVITEYEPCSFENGVYPFIKATTGYFKKCKYNENGDLRASSVSGFRMSEGFLESISNKIFNSFDFRREILAAGYDLEDYVYCDSRLFSSRIYDEYKSCFELFDYITDGALFDFSCRKYISNEELIDDIRKNNFDILFNYLDRSNEALWKLGNYTLDNSFDESNHLLNEYKMRKELVVVIANSMMKFSDKSSNDKKYQTLLNEYKKDRLFTFNNSEFSKNNFRI